MPAFIQVIGATVLYFVRDEGVGGSNPLSPTQIQKPCSTSGVLHLKPDGDEEHSEGQEVRPERSETGCQQRPWGDHVVASHPLYHRQVDARTTSSGDPSL